MNCVDPLRQIKVQFEIPWWSLAHSSRDGLTKGDLPTQTVHGIPKNLPWVWQGLLFCNEYITSQKNVGFQQQKKHPFKTIPQKQGVVHVFFVFDLANAKKQETPFDPKNPTNYSIGCWNLLMIPWMEKISPFPKELIGIVSVQFLFSNNENPSKSTTI